MKKLFTLLTFVFLTSTLLFGQCPDSATPNPNGRFFNMDYALEETRDAALNGLESITFPAGTGCDCGETVTIAVADLILQGPVGADDRYRIRGASETPQFFGGINGAFEGTVTFNMTDGTAENCEYLTTSTSNINGITPVSIFPNPVKDQLTLMNGKGAVTIYNGLGQAVKHLTIDADQASIQLAELFKGQYYLQVIQADGTIVTKQFVKY